MFNFQLGIFVNIIPLYLWEAKNSTFANSGDPDEMLNFIRVSRLFVKVKQILRQNNTFFKNYNLTPLDTCIYNGLSQAYCKNTLVYKLQRIKAF